MAAKKRGTGEGNVYKRSDGRWVGRLSLGFDQNGKRLRKVVYGLTQKEVNDKLDNLKQQRKHGAKSIVGRDTLAGYLQRWLDDDVAINLEDIPSTNTSGAVACISILSSGTSS